MPVNDPVVSVQRVSTTNWISGEDEMEAVIDQAIASMRSPRDMHIICIDVTNRCDLRCSNCTRLLVNQAQHWDMSPDNFRSALKSMSGYTGVIAMIGGNPCVHKEFPALCRIFSEEVPVKRQRGLWSNNVFDYQELIRDTFGFFNLNPHNDKKGMASLAKLKEIIPGIQYYQGNSHHAPLLTAVRDVIPDEAKMWEAISRCDINRNWSASIVQNRGELRAYFCEVAASFDLARGGDHGVPVTEGWWRQSIVDFSDQVKRFCPGCGVPARLVGHLDKDEMDDYSSSNADIVGAARGRRSKIHVASPEQAVRSERAVTDYSEAHRQSEAHGQPAPAPVKVSVVIPCHNAAATIEETIDSILAQREPGAVAVEIIVADDASTDASFEKVAGLAARHPGVIRFLPAVSNTGPAGARNRGLKCATADLVCFLDADDCYVEGFFQLAIDIFVKHPKIAAVMTDIELVNSHREVHPVQLRAMVQSLPSNCMIRRPIAEILGGFPDDPAFRGKNAGEDIVFKQVLCANFAVAHIQQPLLRYRVQRGSHFDWFLDSTNVVDGKIEFLRAPEEQLNGTRPTATEAYKKAAVSRIHAVELYRSGRLFQPGGLELIADYEAQRTRLMYLTDVSALDGYILYRSALRATHPGHVAVSDQLPLSLRRWLEEGSRSEGQLPVITINDIGASAKPAPVRLLVLNASGDDHRWIAELNGGLPSLNKGGCMAVYGWPDGSDVAQLHNAMLITGASWNQLGQAGRVKVFERTG